MNRQNRIAFVALVALVLATTTPSFAASKEIIQLQTQVQTLQDQMARMQQSFDERMGIMRNLIEQSTDSMNRLNGSIAELQRTLQQQQNDSLTRTDQVSGQIQALNDSLDELKGRLARVSKQLEDISAAQQNIPQQTAMPGTVGGPGIAQTQAPPPDILYNNALRDYNAGKLELAQSQFADFLKFYGNTDIAGNAQFYIADIAFRQGNYEQAVKDYDRVLEQYPGGNKTSAAQLKKGMALAQLGQRDAAVRELQSLIQRYPKSIEAATARDQLKKLTPSRATRRR